MYSDPPRPSRSRSTAIVKLCASHRSPTRLYCRVVPSGSTMSMCAPGAQSGSRVASGRARVSSTTSSATSRLVVTTSVPPCAALRRSDAAISAVDPLTHAGDSTSPGGRTPRCRLAREDAMRGCVRSCDRSVIPLQRKRRGAARPRFAGVMDPTGACVAVDREELAVRTAHRAHHRVVEPVERAELLRRGAAVQAHLDRLHLEREGLDDQGPALRPPGRDRVGHGGDQIGARREQRRQRGEVVEHHVGPQCRAGAAQRRLEAGEARSRPTTTTWSAAT